MVRPLWRLPFWSVKDSLARLKSPEHGCRHNTDKLYFSRRIATLIDAHVSRGYGGESSSIQKQIVDALCRGERGRASNLLGDLGNGNVGDFIGILEYCAKSPDPLFVMEAWKIMEEKEISLDDTSCLLIMRALCNGGCLQEASNWINYIGESHGFYPLLPVYNSFLEGCSKMQSVMLANQWLGLMERRLVGKDETTYSELLKLAVRQEDLPAAHDIWKDYMKHYNPSLSLLQKFIKSFGRLNDLQSAYEALQCMVTLTIQGKLFIDVSPKGQLHSSRLDIPILVNGEIDLQNFDLNKQNVSLNGNNATSVGMENREVERDGIVGSCKHISLPVKRVLRWSFDDVISGCAKAKNSGLSEQLMLQMQNLGIQPSSNTYKGFIKAVVSEKGFGEGMKLLKIMEQNNLKPCNRTLATLSVAGSRVLELDLAESLLDQISYCPHPYPYNSFLAACDKMDQPQRALRMLAKMRQLNVQPDTHTYERLFSLFGYVNAPFEDGNRLSSIHCAKRISAIERDMEKNGVQHSELSMKRLLKALRAEGMTKELMQCLHAAEDLFSRNSNGLGLNTYNIVLDSLVKAKESRLAIKLFKRMISSGLTLHTTTYNIMVRCCAIIPSYTSACGLLSMMLRSGFNPTVVTYTSLIKIQLELKNFEQALYLLNQLNSEDIEVDRGAFNTILRTARWKGRIDVIEHIAEQMHRANIRPDPATCYYVFSAYAGRGFVNMAMEAVQVLSMRMICQEDGDLQKLKAEFEDGFILSEDMEAKLQIPEIFACSEERVFTLLILRYCAILGFPISWSPDESQWSRRLSTNYDRRKRTA